MIREVDIYLVIPIVLFFLLILPITLVVGLTPFKLIENSSSKIKFKIRPICDLLIASILGGIGAFFTILLLFHNYYVALNCYQAASSDNKLIDRMQNTIKCKITAESLLLQSQNQSFSDLLGAYVEIDETEKEDNPKGKVVLLTSQNKLELPYNLSHQNIEEANIIADKVNNFIKNHQDKLEIIQDERRFFTYTFLLTIFFSSIALLLVTLANYRCCYFDSESEEFTLVNKSYFKHTILYKIPIEDIAKVKVETHSSEGSIVQSILLCLKSGEEISLTGMADSYGYQQSLAKSINKFLKTHKQKQEKQT